MIPLNTYKKARLDVLKLFYRYHTMEQSELKESSFQNDIETIFKKWRYVVDVRDAKKILKEVREYYKNDPSNYLLLESYKDCVDDMLHSLLISDRVNRAERNIAFCITVKKAQNRYYKKKSRY